MAHNAKKILGLCLMACIAAMLAPINATAQAEEQQTDKMLQPQGLNYAGIYALRQLDPNLTGSGVKFAVISRSITYIDGEPQNDYRPSTENKSFDSHLLYTVRRRPRRIQLSIGPISLSGSCACRKGRHL